MTTVKQFTLIGLCLVVVISAFGCNATGGPEYLDSVNAPKGKDWVALFDGKSLDGWVLRHKDRLSWTVVDGMMVNTSSHYKKGTDIFTERKFDDFEIYYEYRIPPKSNSGVYLRGRYEIQIRDDYGKPATNEINGCLWHTCAPSKNVSRKTGEWQSVWAKIIDKKITVILNGEKVIDEFEVPRPTGAQLDNNEDQPGAIMIQGDHGSIDVRCILVRPLK